MLSLQDKIVQSAVNTLSLAFPELEEPQNRVEITLSTQPQFGHFQCNSAMQLTKQLKQKPRDIAQKIVEKLEAEYGPNAVKDKILFEKIEIAGPGFINLWIDSNAINQSLNAMATDAKLGVKRLGTDQKLVLDFSSPNVAKEMHVGHLRSTIIGDCLANLFEFLDYDVLRLNHIGDWGTAFGMLIVYLKEKHQDVLTGKQETDLPSLMAWYKASKKQFDEDEDFKKRAQLEVVALQGGDDVALGAWRKICEISQKAYHEIYQILDVRIQDRGESFYNPFLEDIVNDLTARGFITVSDGAKCMFLDGFVNRENEPLPFMLQKSDGGYNYATTDLAGMRHRCQVEKANRIIIVTDAGQAQHFAMLYQAAQKVGYITDKTRFDHVPFGLVLGPDGKKFKTRSGETEKLIDLLTEAVDKAKALLEEKGIEFEPVEMQNLAQTIGIGSVKYADLCSNRIGDYVFSYERMLRFEGNTAAFLLYSYVRISSIKRKIKGAVNLDANIQVSHPSEVDLGLHLCQFSNIILNMTNDLLPHRLCEYLFGLANKFNAFFRDCRVEGTLEQDARLKLCHLTQLVLEQGFKILGLKTVERM